MLPPPGGSAPPPTGNRGSTSVISWLPEPKFCLGEIAYISALLLPANLVAGRQCFQSYFSLYLFTVGSYVIIIQCLLDFNMQGPHLDKLKLVQLRPHYRGIHDPGTLLCTWNPPH